MLGNPVYWKKYYRGAESEIEFKRKYSYSDRCRYYLPDRAIDKSIKILIANIRADIPLTLIEQYMPIQYGKIRTGEIPRDAESLLKSRVKDYIDDYIYAVTP